MLTFYSAIRIFSYIERNVVVSLGSQSINTSGKEVIQCMHKTQEWDGHICSLGRMIVVMKKQNGLLVIQ